MTWREVSESWLQQQSQIGRAKGTTWNIVLIQTVTKGENNIPSVNPGQSIQRKHGISSRKVTLTECARKQKVESKIKTGSCHCYLVLMHSMPFSNQTSVHKGLLCQIIQLTLVFLLQKSLPSWGFRGVYQLLCFMFKAT